MSELWDGLRLEWRLMLARLAAPVIVVGIAVMVLTLAACKPSEHRPDPCVRTGCQVENPLAPDGLPDDPAAPVPSCDAVDGLGPCTGVYEMTDGLLHWVYVDTGHQLYDGTARDLGVYVECETDCDGK